MVEKIIIPLDGSVLAEQALAPGLRIAESTGADVLLLRAVPTLKPHAFGNLLTPSTPGLRTIEERVALAERYLAFVKNGRALAGVRMDTVAVIGDAATVIVDAAIHEAADLIVMSTHGATGLDRVVFGSVTEKVLRHAPCALLAVRSAEIPENMLIPIDGSALSEAVVPIAITVASAFNAEITVTRIQEAFDTTTMKEIDALSQLDPELYSRLRVDYDRQTWEYLEAFIADKLSDKMLEATYDVDRGYAPERILAVARRNECDMIAMSTHGRTGLQRWRYGSVTERVLRSAQMPMLIVRPDQSLFDQSVDASETVAPAYA